MLIKSVRDVLKMEQVKNDISAADSSSALVADFSATSSNLFQQQVAVNKS